MYSKNAFSRLSSLLVIFYSVFFVAYVNADADADDYFARITANSGTISLADQAAITTFVTSAKANGYWNKLIDVGPLA